MSSDSPLLSSVTRPPYGPPAVGAATSTLQASFSQRHALVLRLHDVLRHLISLPCSYDNSRRELRAFRILAQCKEVDFAALWRVGAKVLERSREEEGDEGEEEEQSRFNRKAEWLRRCQEGKVDKVDTFLEYALSLAAAGRHRYALEELESFLPSHPYHDSISLNVLAGQLALYLSQPAPLDSSSSDSSSSSSSRRLKRSGSRSSIDSSSDSEKDVKRGASTARTSKTRKVNDSSNDDDGLRTLFRAAAANSPNLFSRASEHFRRAARLEVKNDEASRGEGARWLALLEPGAPKLRAESEDRSMSRSASP